MALQRTATDHLLSVSPSQPLTLDEEIDIDATTDHLILFADLMQQVARPKQYTFFKLDLKQVNALLPMTDRYDCPSVRFVVRQCILDIKVNQPWDVLYLACDEDDVAMGQKAITHLSREDIYDSPDNTLWFRLSQLSGSSQLAFLRGLMPRVTESFGVKLNTNFPYWAKTFDPSQFQPQESSSKRKRV